MGGGGPKGQQERSLEKMAMATLACPGFALVFSSALNEVQRRLPGTEPSVSVMVTGLAMRLA